MYTLGIDIGGTNLRIGLVEQNYNLTRLEKHSVKDLFGKEDACAALAVVIKKYLAAHNAENLTRGICIGFPATVDKKGERVLGAPNLDGFDGVNVKEELSRFLPYPIFIEKDVNLLIRCDLWRTKSTARDIVAAYVGTGLGNAIMLDGVLHKGANGVAGELGHIPFGDTDESCGCGNFGCAEPLVGGKYLAKLCETTFTDTHISELFSLHRGEPLLEKYVDRLARVIASEVNIIDPELLILGGGVINMKDFPKEELARQIKLYVRKPLPHDALKIEFSVGADECGVIGAGIAAWEKVN